MNIEKSLIADIKSILQNARQKAYAAVNFYMVEAYWRIGERIVMEEQKGAERAGYGEALIEGLSKKLTADCGKGFSEVNLKSFRKFYLTFQPDQKRHAVRAEFQSPESQSSAKGRAVRSLLEDAEIPAILRKELTWTHYRLIMRVENPHARRYYMNEAADHTWSTRTLERNINTLYYERILTSKNKSEALTQAALPEKQSPADFVKCFALFDIKTGKLTHQDIGQMDMYVRMFDDLERSDTDNPTIGVILCTSKDQTIVKYSVLNDNDQIFATKYRSCLPTEEELVAEIEREKTAIQKRLESK